jgi:hypothetical protein
MNIKLQPNDLIRIEPWDCEGIEQPWGWFQDDPPSSKKMKKFKKVKLSSGSTGIVIEQGMPVTDDYDEHCVILVESKALSVPVRFLHRVD